MNYNGNKAENVKIAYIGGGSRGWAWGLMSDLAMADDISGDVYLYDIDYEAAQHNELIGNRVKDLPDCKSVWNYKAVETIGEAMTGADFVVISILPGTFEEMRSDVHCPEKYGIYQPVGDTTGPGGIIRALRTIPMIEVIGKAIKEYCPDAWVINYTNPMALCIRALYDVFPDIKAFGCCHEVFGTQKLLAKALDEICGIKDVDRKEIKTNVIGLNHFTWLNKAKYRDIDVMDVFDEFVDKNSLGVDEAADQNWMNKSFTCTERVKMDLFKRYGYIAAAGDRHLAEFCEGNWYLQSPEQVKEWKYELTPVDWRVNELNERLARSARLISGEEQFKIEPTGEEGVEQMRALLGLTDLVTNVNLPNQGQIPNLPMGVVVETNAVFRADSLEPVFAGEIPEGIYPLIARVAGEQNLVARATRERSLDLAFKAFVNDQLVQLNLSDAKKLFDEMVSNTKAYLGEYFD